jgi:hypothetical protein
VALTFATLSNDLNDLARPGSCAQLPGLPILLAPFVKDDNLSFLTKFHLFSSHLQHYCEKPREIMPLITLISFKKKLPESERKVVIHRHGALLISRVSKIGRIFSN